MRAEWRNHFRTPAARKAMWAKLAPSPSAFSDSCLLYAGPARCIRAALRQRFELGAMDGDVAGSFTPPASLQKRGAQASGAHGPSSSPPHRMHPVRRPRFPARSHRQRNEQSTNTSGVLPAAESTNPRSATSLRVHYSRSATPSSLVSRCFSFACAAFTSSAVNVRSAAR